MNIRKPHPNLTVRSSTSVNFSAAQWGLKTDEFPRLIIEKVASILNGRITREYNRGEPEEHTRSAVVGIMTEFKIYGANDKKPKEFLDRVLRNLYVGTTSQVKEPK